MIYSLSLISLNNQIRSQLKEVFVILIKKPKIGMAMVSHKNLLHAILSNTNLVKKELYKGTKEQLYQIVDVRF